MPDQNLLDLPLPLERSSLPGPAGPCWTYRRYFQAIEKALSRKGFADLRAAVSRKGNLPAREAEPKRVRIWSEKHGNWYHPARIEVLTSRDRFTFVLNVALTERGKAILPREVEALTLLHRKYPYSWLPRLYSLSVPVSTAAGKEGAEGTLSFFLADWFEGFHEFHISFDPVNRRKGVRVWDGTAGRFLSESAEGRLYAQAAKILTCYYDPRTYEEIHPWHHGAGDFVVQEKEGDEVEVRLISVRQYAPLTDPAETSPPEALLFFFLNLSLRMRLDRLDGVGETAWAEERCLPATWEGFLQGLAVQMKEGRLDPSLRDYFFRHSARLSLEGMVERFSAILDSYDPQAPDLPVIRQHIVHHIQAVHHLLQTSAWVEGRGSS